MYHNTRLVPAGGLEGLLGAGRGGRGLPGAGTAAPLPSLTFALPPLPSVSSNKGCGLTGGCPCPDSFVTTDDDGVSFAVEVMGGVGVVGDSTDAILFTVSPS